METELNITTLNRVPMFQTSPKTTMEQPMANRNAQTPNETQIEAKKEVYEISLFDVKELYDLAYDAKSKGDEDTFKAILAEAVQLDLGYRRQLAADASYKDQTKKNNFKEASKATQAA